MLTPPLVLPHPRNAHVFTKDLEKLTADLEATCDEAAVVQRYKNTLVVKGKVCCESWLGFGSVMLTPLQVCTSVRIAGENGDNGGRTKTSGDLR